MQSDLKRHFCREKGKRIWEVVYEDPPVGPWEFSFDKKTIYNFWTDYWDLTDEQRKIFDEEFPVMAALKNPDVVYEEDDEDEDEDEDVEPEYEYSD